jgi:hypothetical protein
MRISPEIKLEFRIVDFYGGRKTGGPVEKPSWQGREPTNNSTHMKYLSRGSNPRPIRPQRWKANVLPQHHPCHPKFSSRFHFVHNLLISKRKLQDLHCFMILAMLVFSHGIPSSTNEFPNIIIVNCTLGTGIELLIVHWF